MALLHALVSRGSTILAESSKDVDVEAGFSGLQKLLSKIPPNDSKLTYQLEDHLIHYVRQNGVTVLAVADAELPRRVAFGFLNELHRRFMANYSEDDVSNAEALAMTGFNKQIGDLMDQFTNNPPPDPVRAAQEEITGVKQIMTQNIEAILSRGERIELLVDKTDNLGNQAAQFRKRSQALRRKMWWKNSKLIALTAFVIVILLFLLISNARGS
ncbi:MAG: hypothetical protein CYPHOPRED_005407 [Cyphobasidiales sp. Tagirdzhanova-0007]|nr:MAG: hypothetical protein CYPHOPRED_005407 [Cyphobasidiales sp. Tagirdzhanova-0007]